MSNLIDLALIGNRGFAIQGAAAGDYSGFSVSSAGDVNNDGYDDIIIGAYSADLSSRLHSGISYVIYGGVTKHAEIDLENIGAAGFAIYGAAAGDRSGCSVSSAGDINNDGYDDILIVAYTEDPKSRGAAGTVYVIYGGATKYEAVDLLKLGTKGFVIYGAAAGDNCDVSVSSAGDVNNDGYDDIIIGTCNAAPDSKLNAGTTYVIYGGPKIYKEINLAYLGESGFVIYGAAANDYSGSSVSSAGDVNSDGYDDIIIGAYNAGPSSRFSAGISYVIYGGTTNNTAVDLLSLDAAKGFAIHGAAAFDRSGFSVSSAGDVNSDGYDDIIIGAGYASLSSRQGAGISYVIYGRPSRDSAVDLLYLGTNGFAIYGAAANDRSGWSVSSAGDVNSDGYDDIIVGAIYASLSSRSNAGTSYVVYGRPTTNASVDLLYLGLGGLTIYGAANGGHSGWSVSSAGDINSDGYYDIIIGAFGATPSSKINAGTSYVIYGGNVSELAPTPSSKESLLETPVFTSSISAGFSILSIISAWLLRNKIAIYILDNWGHKYILYNPYVQLKENEIAIKLSLNNQLIVIANFQEYPLLDEEGDSRGISKALYNTIKQNIENPKGFQPFTLLQYEKNQIRDYLIAHKYIEPTQTFGCLKGYTELGYIKGTLYNHFLQNFEANHAQYSKNQARKEDIHNLSIDQEPESKIESFSTSNPLQREGLEMKTFSGNNRANAKDIESSFSGVQSAEISDRDTKVGSEVKTNQRSCVVCSIDAMMDPQHVRLQNEEFTRFGRHLTYAYQDIAKMISEQFSTSQNLLKDDVIPAEGANSIHETGFPSTELSASLPRFQNALELYPLVKYIGTNIFYPLVENYIPESLQNITFPEISRTMLITAHMSIGHLYAWQQPQSNVPFYIVESVAKSGSFAARLGVTKFINDYKDALEHNEQTITTTESIKHCASTILTYTVPDLLICAAARAAMPGYECSDMNLGAKLSFAGSECYWSYKASQEPIEPTAVDIVIPYIADLAAGVAAYVNGYGLMGVVSSIITADWMSKVVMDKLPSEIKIYADLSLDSAVEFVTAKVMGSYSFAFENESVN